METNFEDKVDSYIELYDSIREKCESDSAAIAIFQEAGKDRRSEQIREERENKNHEPATDKQKRFMKSLGIDFPVGVTKKEASALLDQELKTLE